MNGNGNGTENGTRHSTLPPAANRAIFLAVVCYFALIGYATVANDPLAALAAEFVFGAIAIGIGALLFRQSDRTLSVPLAAAAAFVVGGALQFGYLFSGTAALDSASSLAVFVGVGLYIYAVFGE